jgi:hypothetical protein
MSLSLNYGTTMKYIMLQSSLKYCTYYHPTVKWEKSYPIEHIDIELTNLLATKGRYLGTI